MTTEREKSKDELISALQLLREENAKLLEDKRRFITLTGNLNGVVYRCANDRQFTMEYVSEDVTRLTGYDPAELENNRIKSWKDLILPEDRELVRNTIQDAIAKKERFTITYRILDKKGSKKWVWEQGCGIFDEQGNFQALEGFITDVSHQIEQEKLIRENEKQFRDLYENAPFAYFSVTADGIITQCNKRAERLLDYPPGTLTGKKFTELFSTSGKENRAALISEAIRNGHEMKDREVLLRNKKGSDIWTSLTINAYRNHAGDNVESRILVFDISKRKTAQQDLKNALQRLSLATRSAGLGIWDQDLRTGKVVWNSRMYEIYGRRPEDFDGSITLWNSYVNPGDLSSALDAYHQAIHDQGTFQTHFRITRPDGSIRHIQAYGLIQADNHGEPVRMSGVNIDETDRVINEEHILRINRLYTVLSNINQAIVRERDPQRIFEETCVIAIRDGKLDQAWIGVASKTDGNLNMASFAGDDENLKAYLKERIEDGKPVEGIPGEVLRNGKPVIVRDLSGHQPNGETAKLKELGYRSLACFPLMTGNIVRGIFSLYSRAPGFFEAEEVRLLSELSADISYAVEFSDKEQERKEYHKQLREATSTLKAIIEASPLAILHLSPEGYVQLWNHAAEEIFGWTAGEVTGKFLPIVQEEKFDEFREIRENVLRGRKYTSAELVRKRKNGNRVQISLSTAAVYDSENKVEGIIEVIEDITERKRAEKKILESEARYRYLFENNPHPMMVYDLKTLAILEVNDAAVSKYGYNRDEFLSMDVTQIRPSQERKKFLGLISAEREPIRHAGIWKHQLKNGSIIDVDITSHTLSFKGHDAALVLAQDVTERKKWEEDLIRAKEEAERSNRLKDAFVANISHEIRTPLNSILGFSELIREHLNGLIDEEVARYFDSIDRSSLRLMRTVDMILNFSRLQVGAFTINPHLINMPGLLEEIRNEHKLSAEAKSLSLTFTNEAGDVWIMADEYSIMQAVSNLVDNSIKYTDKGFINLKLYKGENDQIMLDVSDSGIGISENFFEDLFKPYSQEDIGYTRNYEGIGLGLSMVKRYLELNDATITFRSKQGEGTVFTINFHQAESGPDQLQLTKEAEQVRAPGLSPDSVSEKPVVLVVEDDLFSQEFMTIILEDEFEVLVADGAAQAYQELKRKDVSIILMDISLKGDMDGLQLIRELRKEPVYHAMPIIVLTAHAFAEDRKRSFDAGGSGYFSKPFKPQELIHEMNKLLQTT